MKTTLSARASAAVLAVSGCMVLGALALAIGFGPLSPPAGAVTGTAKPLSEVEPRIAVNATNTPGAVGYTYVISSPGSYYLTGDVQGAAGVGGIVINASNVTLDLNGFSVIGSAGGSVQGISYLGAPTNLVIRNGTVRSWSNNGIDVVGCVGCVISDILAVGNAGVGIRAGNNNRVVRCTVRGTSTTGLSLGSYTTASECLVTACTTGIQLNGSCLVVNCAVSDASLCVSCAGVNIVRGCHLRPSTSASQAGTAIATNSFDNRFEGNHIAFCATGISLGGAGGNLVVRNSFSRTTTPVTGTGMVAPLVTAANLGTNTNPDANYQQ